jgi:hypothetical protein
LLERLLLLIKTLTEEKAKKSPASEEGKAWDRMVARQRRGLSQEEKDKLKNAPLRRRLNGAAFSPNVE